MKEQSQRQLRVSEKLRHIMAEYLQRENFGDPELEHANLMTVSEVRMSPDLKNATVYVSCLDNAREDTIIKALNKNSKQMKGPIGRKAALRFAPKLYFVSDTAFDYAYDIEKLMRDEKVQKDIRRGEEE